MSTVQPFSSTRISRGLVTAFVAVIVGALLATVGPIGAASAAHQTVSASATTFTVRVSTPTGQPLSTLKAVAYEVGNGEVVSGSTSVTAKAVAGKPGSFAFAALRPVSYTIAFYPSGSAAGTAFGQFLGGETSISAAETFVPTANNNSLDVSLAANSVISGTLKNSSGAKLKGITVVSHYFLDGRWQEYTSAMTGADGRYWLTDIDPGAYKLEFRTPFASSYAAEFSGDALSIDSASVIDARVGLTTKVDAVLATGGAISGTASFNYGGDLYKISGAEAIAYPLIGAINTYSPKYDVATGISSKPSNSKGAWKISGLPAGNYVVKVFPNYYDVIPGFVYSDGHYKIFNVKPGSQAKAGAARIAVSNGGALAITVTGAGGKRLKNAKVTLVRHGIDSYIYRGTTNAKGQLVVGVVKKKKKKLLVMQPTSYDIRVSAIGYETINRQLSVSRKKTKAQSLSLAAISGFGFISGPLLKSRANDAVVGSVFSVSAATNRKTAVTSYQWLRNGRPILDAVGASYTSQPADFSQHVSVRVTARIDGSRPVFGYAHAGGANAKIGWGATPTNEVLPSVSAALPVRVGDVLTARPGTWSVPGIGFSYEWLSGTEVRGTSRSYVAKGTDIGSTISVRVTTSQAGRKNASATSTPVQTALRPAPAALTQPSVSSAPDGDAIVYTAHSGVWSPGTTTVRSFWRIDGDESASQTYRSHVEDEAARIAVRFVITAPGYAPTERIVIARGSTAVPISDSAPVVTDRAENVPVVSGDQRVWSGSVLSLIEEPGQWTYPDPSSAVSSRTNQWMRAVGGADAVPIVGATASTYTPRAGDLGAALSVETTVKSPGYGDYSTVVVAGTVGLDPALVRARPGVEIDGSPVPTSELTAKVGSWAVAPDTVLYSWLSCQDDCDSVEDFALIAGENLPTFTPGEDSDGISVIASVTAAKAGFEPATSISDATLIHTPETIAVRKRVALEPDGNPKIGIRVGVRPGDYDVRAVQRSYRWQVCGDSCEIDANWLDARGVAENPTYTPVPADLIGSDSSKLRVVETVQKSGYEPIESTSTGAVIALGTATMGRAPVVIANSRSYKFSDLGDSIPASATTNVTWLEDSYVSDQEGAIYYLDTGIGGVLRAKIEYVRPGYEPISRVVIVRKGDQVRHFASMKTRYGIPLVAPDVSLSYPDWANDTVRVSYRWLLDGATISGQTGRSYTPQLSQLGHVIKVQTTAISPYFQTTVQQFGDALATGWIQTDGASLAYTGEFSPGTVVSAIDDVTTIAHVSRSYEWERYSDKNDFETIGSGRTYTLTSADVGSEIWVSVDIKAPGYDASWSRSARRMVVPTSNLAPGDVPELIGSAAVGKNLTVSTPRWRESGLAVSYQWLRDGMVLPGATAANYTLVRRDAGSGISVRLTVSRKGVVVGSVLSNIAIVAVGAAPTATAVPKLTGTTVACGVISATAGKWSRGNLILKYQWFAGATAIPQATSYDYTINAKYVGQRLSVRVSAVSRGYADGAATSTSSAAITAKAGCSAR